MIRAWLITLCFCSCTAVYHLNDTEYQRMPPLFSLDKYEPCLIEEGSTYCMLQLKLHAEPGNELMQMINDYSDHSYTHYDHSIIDKGICVKKTCQKYIKSSNTSLDLSHSLEACMHDSLKREYGLNAKLSTLYYCDHYNEPRYIDGWDWTVLVVMLVLVIINIVGSVYDYMISKQTGNTPDGEKAGNALLISFSIIRNWKRLVITEQTDDKIRNLRFFNGVRILTNLCVIISHAMLSYAVGFTSNPHEIEKSYQLPLYHIIYNGLMVVQVFFFVSGFLMVYGLQTGDTASTYTVWDVLKITMLKYIRLVPALAMTLALSTTWVRHMSSGPLWKMFVTGSLVGDCRNYWWRHLFFVNNYLQEKNFCLLPTWHLAADMQVFLVCLTAYILTRGRTRNLVLGTLLVLSAVAPALQTMLQDVDTIILTPENYRSWRDATSWYMHILGHNHMVGFIIGMGTASRLCDWQKKGGHLVKNRWYSLVQYLSFVAVPLTLYTGRAFYQFGVQSPLLLRASYVFVVRLLVGLACAVVISTMFTKTSTYLKSLFESRFLVVPSRLSYCVFLVHMVIVHIFMGIRTQPNVFSAYNMLAAFFCILMTSYLVALPLYLLVEAPFATLFRNLFMGRSKNNKSVNRTEKDKHL